MAGLQFRFAELVREARALESIAREFLDPSTAWALQEFRRNIESLWDAADNGAHRLELKPLKTAQSRGDYEAGPRQGGPVIYAVVTGAWEMRPIGDNPKKMKGRAKRLVQFSGKASTQVELFDTQAPNDRIGMWRMELGAHDSPGCYFHVQVFGDDVNPPFPSTVPIPRFPTVFVTPMSAVEYVLGELFQDRWQEASSGSSGDLAYWKSLQEKRLKKVLAWYGAILTGGTSSPWMAVKSAKPDAEMFLE